MAQKPSIPKGTRDFTPAEMARRNYIFDTIRTVFKLHGFQQIETPAMENLSTLMGKYGEEGDKLLFKILNSGDFLRGADPQLIQSAIAGDDSAKLAAKICEKGLRYDLTVPFARFVVMHRNDLSFPFKRFQIQPVWRADRPQKGRYREFYQCDADVIGSDSLINEIELLQLIDDVFSRLGIRITIKLNNRKVLAGIADLVGAPDKIVDITVAIDKIDKIGLDNVKAELGERGLSAEAIDRITTGGGLWIWIAVVVALLVAGDYFFRRTAFVKGVNQSLRRIWNGFVVLFHMKGTGLYIVLTFGIWICHFLDTYLCFFAFPFTRQLISGQGYCWGLIPGLVVFVFGSCSMGVPSNGGLGPWNIAVMFALSLFGISDSDGAAYSLVCWSFQTAMLIASGIFSAIYIMLSRRRLTGHRPVTDKVNPINSGNSEK